VPLATIQNLESQILRNIVQNDEQTCKNEANFEEVCAVSLKSVASGILTSKRVKGLLPYVVLEGFVEVSGKMVRLTRAGHAEFCKDAGVEPTILRDA